LDSKEMGETIEDGEEREVSGSGLNEGGGGEGEGGIKGTTSGGGEE